MTDGRIARAIADMSLARSKKVRSAFTACPRKSAERKAYYDMLEASRKADLISRRGSNGFWLSSSCFDGAEKTLAAVFQKGRLLARSMRRWKTNERQRECSIACWTGSRARSRRQMGAAEKCSPDTALRDIRTARPRYFCKDEARQKHQITLLRPNKISETPSMATSCGFESAA